MEQRVVMPPTFEPLHGQANWLTWKLQAYLYFEMNGLKKIIDGTETIPDEPVLPAMAAAQALHDQHEAAVQRRERALEKAALVKYVLSRTVDAEHHHIFVSKATPREQWVALEAVLGLLQFVYGQKLFFQPFGNKICQK